MNITIAIVDDEKIELETIEIFLRFYIKNFLSAYESRINIETFYRAKDFLCVFDPKIYQVVVLGVNMHDIFKLIGDNDVKFIFIKPEEEIS